MQKDAFNELLVFIREEIKANIPSTIVTGIVESPLPNLIIQSNGISLDNDDLEIDYKLKQDINGPLQRGDKVVMYKQGDLFLIVSKVVKL